MHRKKSGPYTWLPRGLIMHFPQWHHMHSGFDLFEAVEKRPWLGRGCGTRANGGLETE